MAKIRLSFEITEEGRDNLLAIAKELGCYWSGKPSWRKMLTRISNLEFDIVDARFSTPGADIQNHTPKNQMVINSPEIGANTIVYGGVE